MKQVVRWVRWRLGLALAMILTLGAVAARGQPLPGGAGTLGGSKLAGYYEDQRQMRWLLAGSKMQPIGGGRFLLTDAKLQTFTRAGEHDMDIQAPECVADPRQGIVSSSGPLRVESVERGRFSLDGEGFQWSTNSLLFISNKVHTLIQGNVTKPDSAESNPSRAGDMDIRAHQFEYSTNLGLAVWRGEVQLSATNLTLMSDQLSAKFVEKELESILAETNVRIDSAGIQANGPQALYAIGSDQVRMSGRPSWRAGQRDGTADELVVEGVVGGTNRTLRAEGHAVLKMPAQNVAASELLGGRGAREGATPEGTAGRVEILADHYVLQANTAEFSREVRLKEWVGNEAVGGLDCERLTAAFSGTNLDRMVAEQQVVIRRTGRLSGVDSSVTTNVMTAGRAEYEGASGVLNLEDHPAWHTGGRSGEGDRITLFVQRTPEEMRVAGHAVMRLPGEDLGRIGGLTPGDEAAHSSVTSNRPPAEIRCEQYSLASTGGVFQGGVRIEHPQMNWLCRQLSLARSEAANTREFLADGDVVFEYLNDPKGKKMQGAGDKVFYKFSEMAGRTNELITLKGYPARLTTDSGSIADETIIWDRTRARIALPPKYLIHLEGPPINTNAFGMPKSKSKSKAKKSSNP